MFIFIIVLSACNTTNQSHVNEGDAIESDYNGESFTTSVIELQDYSDEQNMVEVYDDTLLLLTLEIETDEPSELNIGRDFYNGIQVEWEQEFEGDLHDVEAEPFIDDLKEVTDGEHFIDIEETYLGPNEKTTIDLPYRIGEDHGEYYIRIHFDDQVFQFSMDDVVNP